MPCKKSLYNFVGRAKAIKAQTGVILRRKVKKPLLLFLHTKLERKKKKSWVGWKMLNNVNKREREKKVSFCTIPEDMILYYIELCVYCCIPSNKRRKKRSEFNFEAHLAPPSQGRTCSRWKLHSLVLKDCHGLANPNQTETDEEDLSSKISVCSSAKAFKPFNCKVSSRPTLVMTLFKIQSN